VIWHGTTAVVLVIPLPFDGFSAVNIRSGYDNVIDITTPHRFLVDTESE
jgi:hypothetical protein